jgi:hypothetical protein
VDESATGSVNFFLEDRFRRRRPTSTGRCTLGERLRDLVAANYAQNAGILLATPLRRIAQRSNVRIAPSTERD